MRNRKVRREDTQESSTTRNERRRLYGSESRALCDGSAGSKRHVGHDILDDDTMLLAQRPSAGRDVVRLHALEEIQKFALEAVLRSMVR
jgi:hypothetical protein